MNKKAFSLVELSISLVIIALIISAIMAVNGLSESAKIQGIISELTVYRDAANKFKGIYLQYPGDLGLAANYWSSGCSTGGYSCNGNGNGYIENIADTNVSGSDEEIVKAWKHLSLANLVPMQFALYSGMTYTYQFAPNSQMPLSKAANVQSVYLFNGSPTFIMATLTDIYYTPFTPAQNAIYLSGIFRVSTGDLYSFNSGVLTSLEAFTLDQKIDDGHYDDSGNAVGAITGNFRSFTSGQIFVEANFSDPEIGNVQCLDGSGNYLVNQSFLNGSRPKCNIGWGL
ncbi:MAG: type II secretion system protein [Rickettsiales bacterium]